MNTYEKFSVNIQISVRTQNGPGIAAESVTIQDLTFLDMCCLVAEFVKMQKMAKPLT